jgi:DnaJ-class molecular chaperone
LTERNKNVSIDHGCVFLHAYWKKARRRPASIKTTQDYGEAKEVSMNMWMICPDCKGSGKDVVGWGPFVQVVGCLACRGAGKIPLEKPEYPEPNEWKIKKYSNGDFEWVLIKPRNE